MFGSTCFQTFHWSNQGCPFPLVTFRRYASPWIKSHTKWRDGGSNHCVQEDTWYVCSTKHVCVDCLLHIFDMFLYCYIFRYCYIYLYYICKYHTFLDSWHLWLILAAMTDLKICRYSIWRTWGVRIPRSFRPYRPGVEVTVVNPWLIHPCLFNKREVVYILLETNITPESFIVRRLVFSLLFFWDEPFFRCEVLVSGNPSHPTDG